MPRNAPVQKYIVCNSDESEPGTCKDRDILRFNPHALVEGMAIAGYCIGATVGYNYMRGEFLDEPYERFAQAVKEAYANGYLGKNIQGSGVDFDLYPTLGAGAISVARKLHCWNRWKVKKVSRVLSHRFPPMSVCMANPPRLITPNHCPQCPALCAMARTGLRTSAWKTRGG